jgi:LPXTG-motif cell wall-anchored protein
MTTRSRFTCVGALLVAAALVAATATAQVVDKRTTFTFNGPVAVPGVTLPAGSYLFRLANPESSQHVVQVLSADGGTPYAMFFALQAYRNKPAEEPEVRFMETAADMPHAIRTWWYPGQTTGYEFMYPREQARLLAAGSGTPVLSTEFLPPAVSAEPEWIVPDFNPEAMPEELVAESAVTGEAVYEAPAPAELPKTDSPTTTIVLAGLGALVIGLFVHTLRVVRS